MVLQTKILFQILILFSITVLVLFSWTIIAVPAYEKSSKDFQMYVEHEGENQIADNIFGELSEPFRLEETLNQKIIGIDGDILTIKSVVQGFRAENKEVIFEFEKIYLVNQNTLMHLDMDEMFFDFLPDVKKQNYNFYHPLIFQESTLIFQNTEKLDGLVVYVFTSETLADDFSYAYPQFSSNAILGDSFSKLWIEPITGNIIKFEKNWESYVLIDGTEKNIVEKGWKHTTAFTESILIEHAMIKIEKILIFKIIIPIFLLISIFGIGVALILLHERSLTNKKMIKREKIAIVGEFASMFSHDIRNPLSNIQMIVNMLKNNKDLTSDPEIKDKFQILTTNLDRIDHQVNDVLDFVRTTPLEKKRGRCTFLFI